MKLSRIGLFLFLILFIFGSSVFAEDQFDELRFYRVISEYLQPQLSDKEAELHNEIIELIQPRSRPVQRAQMMKILGTMMGERLYLLKVMEERNRVLNGNDLAVTSWDEAINFSMYSNDRTPGYMILVKSQVLRLLRVIGEVYQRGRMWAVFRSYLVFSPSKFQEAELLALDGYFRAIAQNGLAPREAYDLMELVVTDYLMSRDKNVKSCQAFLTNLSSQMQSETMDHIKPNLMTRLSYERLLNSVITKKQALRNRLSRNRGNKVVSLDEFKKRRAEREQRDREFIIEENRTEPSKDD